MVKNLPATQEIQVQSLGQEDPLKNGTAIHSSTLAWRIPWTEEPGGLQSVGSQRVGHDWVTNTTTITTWTRRVGDIMNWKVCFPFSQQGESSWRSLDHRWKNREEKILPSPPFFVYLCVPWCLVAFLAIHHYLFPEDSLPLTSVALCFHCLPPIFVSAPSPGA